MKKIIAALLMLAIIVFVTLTRERKLPIMNLDLDWYRSEQFIHKSYFSKMIVKEPSKQKPTDVNLSFCSLNCIKKNSLCTTVGSWLPCYNQPSGSSLDFDLFSDEKQPQKIQASLSIDIQEPSWSSCYIPLYKKSQLPFSAEVTFGTNKLTLQGVVNTNTFGFCSCYSYKKQVARFIAEFIQKETSPKT